MPDTRVPSWPGYLQISQRDAISFEGSVARVTTCKLTDWALQGYERRRS